MGELWQTSVGSELPPSRRRSAEEATRRRGRVTCHDPDDFRDVFGGPPRSVLLRHFDGDLPAFFSVARPSPPLSHDSYKPPAAARRVRVRTEPGFYDDIFGSDGGGDVQRSSRSRSSASTSVLSSERLSPPLLGASMTDNTMLASASSSSFAYDKLRPLKIPQIQQQSPSPLSTESRVARSSNGGGLIAMQHPSPSCFFGFKHDDESSSIDMFGFSCCGFSPSPDTFILESSFRGSHARPLPWEDSSAEETLSSSVMSPVLVVEAEREPKCVMMEEEIREEGEAAESSFVMEFDGHHRKMRGSVGDAAALDEAIAWASDKFWT
ncbi:hypothetical protein Cni_G12119 [Canna indica]|uniref:Uncharacterized protein n=1 Tax=Canna indica TaxID=4628 RepID=A0AAQ3K7T7_9LILI|nr:hypothetical protein Cni_G12119 [Canna indica]